MFDLSPTINVMTQEQISKIHDDALQILEKTGIVVDDKNARQLFEKRLGKSQDDNRIRITKDLVQWAIEAAPSEINIYDRLGSLRFKLSGDGSQNTVFGIGVTNLNYHDPTDNRIKPFSRNHMSLVTRLGHSLDHFDFISTPGVIQDLPTEDAELYGVLEMVSNTTKPIVLLIADGNAFEPALDLCEHLAGNLSDRPFLIPYVNPITPLVLNTETTQKMHCSIQRGLPLIFSNYGMSGATCPITPSGTLALLTAELLAGLVYSQLVKKGAPIILGNLPAAFDMKKASSFYSPQTLLLNLACADIMTSYNIPHCGTSGSGNGWAADLSAATTLCINHFTNCLGKTGMVPFVGGNFESLVFSPELVVYSNDLIHQSRMFKSGFSINNDPVEFSDISTIGPGGNFLLSSQTAKHFKNSQFSSTIWPLLSLDKWREQGEPEAKDILREKTLQLLEKPKMIENYAEIIAKGTDFLKNMK